MQLQVPRLTKVNKIIIFSGIFLFLVQAIASALFHVSLVSLLGISQSAIYSFKIWTPLTYAFLPMELFSLLFGSLAIWFLGSELESLWGSTRYLGYILTTVLGGAFFFLLISFIFHANQMFLGYVGISTSLCIAYATIFPNKILYLYIFPVKGKYFAMILIAISLYYGIFSHGGVQAWGELGMFASTFLWMMYISKKASRKKNKFVHKKKLKPNKSKDDNIYYLH